MDHRWTYDDVEFKIVIKIYGDNIFAGIPENTVIDLSKQESDYRISVSVLVSDPADNKGLGPGMGGIATIGGMGGPELFKTYGVWVGDLVPLWDTDAVTKWTPGSQGTLTIFDFQITEPGPENNYPEYSYKVNLKDVLLYTDSDWVATLSNGKILPNNLLINSATVCVSNLKCA